MFKRPKRRGPRPPHTLDGFSVLEAMIAMAILAAAMLPLLGLQSQLVRTVGQYERIDARLIASENAIARIKPINFTLQQSGTFDDGTVRVRWQATAAEPPRNTQNQGGGAGRYEITLYNVAVSLTFSTGEQETLQLKGLGWRPLWPISSGL